MSTPAEPELTPERADELIRSRPFMGLLVLAGIVGIVVSFAAWLFLEGTYQLQQVLFTHLPDSLGIDGDPPVWYLVVVLGLAGVIVAFAVARLPGNGGHVPAHGLAGDEPTPPIDLPGVLLAAIGTIGFGLVLGPEAPLIALGGGLAIWTVQLARREVPPQVLLVIAAGGTFAAVSFIFGSPIIAAVLLIEATALGGARQRVILLPGLLAAGLGSLLATGVGSVTGLSTSDFALGPLSLPKIADPTLPDLLWTVALAAAVAIVVQLLLRIGRETERQVTPRPFLVIPAIGIVVALLASAFGAATDESAMTVLLSGQDALPGLVTAAPAWPVGTVVLLIVCKGLAYGLSLGAFRGGPTFPALFLGAAAGILAAKLPGFELTAAVAVGMAAATVAVLRLPLSAAILGILLTAESGAGSAPLVVVAVVIAMVITLRFSHRIEPEPAAPAGSPAT